MVNDSFFEEQTEGLTERSMIYPAIASAVKIPNCDSIKDFIDHDFSFPAQVVSCAGSGKTTQIVAKIIEMGLSGADLSGICVLTFNTEAAKHMNDEITKACERAGLENKTTVKTFHAFYSMVLKYIQSMDNTVKWPKIANNAGEMLSRAFYKKSNNKKDAFKKDMYTYISFAVNNKMKLDDIIQDKNELTNTKNVYAEYMAMKKLAGVMDFDDLQIRMYGYMSRNEALREKIKDIFDYWFVDEFQDISLIQWEILVMCIKDMNNLVVVGDDDQNIYEFRGSNPKFILDMEIFVNKPVRQYYSVTNYRCKSEILTHANRLITNNRIRLNKNMNAYNNGGIVNVNRGLTIDYDALADDIIEKSKIGSTAVLYRNNEVAAIISDKLFRKGGVFSLRGEYVLLSKHKFTKIMIDCVNACFSKNEDRILEQTKYFNARTISGEATAKMTLAEIVEVLKMNTRDVLSFISGFQYLGFNVIWDYLVELYGDLTFLEFKNALEIDYARLEVNATSKNTYAIELSTIHAVKGLQWDNVFVIGVDDKIFPAMDFIKEGAVSEVLAGARSIEAERRLMYVAMTRAKNYLSLWGSVRSIFLDEVQGLREPQHTGEIINVRRVLDLDLDATSKILKETPKLTFVDSASMDSKLAALWGESTPVTNHKHVTVGEPDSPKSNGTVTVVKFTGDTTADKASFDRAMDFKPLAEHHILPTEEDLDLDAALGMSGDVFKFGNN